MKSEPPARVLEERFICTLCPCSEGMMSPEAMIARFCPVKVRLVGSVTLPLLFDMVPAPPVGLITSGEPLSVPLPWYEIVGEFTTTRPVPET